MAQGQSYTHAGESMINFHRLSSWCLALGVKKATAESIAKANTAREALGFILDTKEKSRILDDIAGRALTSARRFAGSKPVIIFYLFNFDGGLLMSKKDGE